MTVFVSWSGELSRSIAELLKKWIEDVLQGVQVWISSRDIEKGAFWFGDLAASLEQTNVGIICVTHENKDAPWILFEAGALSKGLSTNRVMPLLIDLSTTDLRPPLSSFNAVLPDKHHMLELIKADLLTAISRLLEVDEQNVQISMARENRWDKLQANMPIKRQKVSFEWDPPAHTTAANVLRGKVQVEVEREEQEHS